MTFEAPKKPKLSPPQFEFLADHSTPFIAFSGGMGSGKSLAAALKAIDLARRNPGEIGIVWAPTIRDARENVIAPIAAILRGEHGSMFHIAMPFKLNKSTGSLEIYVQGANRPPSTIYVRSGEQDIVGTNAAWAIADELDTLSARKARENFEQLVQRVRSPTAKCKQLAITTTPEGHRFMWQFFVQDLHAVPELSATRRIIYGDLSRCTHIPDDYIQNLMATHTPAQQRARIYGEFVNLNNSRVYEYFDREIHHTSKTLDDFPSATLFVGWDFNVTNMAAVIGVQLPEALYILSEHIGTKENPIFDTPTMIRLLKARYPGRNIIACPDASGENRNANNGLITSIGQIQAAGIKCLHSAQNPPVELRIANVNRMLYNTTIEGKTPRIYVNTKLCPMVTQTLEQQPYTTAGVPDKEHGLDHPADALGYLVVQTFGERLRKAMSVTWQQG